MESKQKQPGLYEPRFEHDNCGIGAVANIKGIRSHRTVDQALHIVENLEHRAGKDAEGKTCLLYTSTGNRGGTGKVRRCACLERPDQ